MHVIIFCFERSDKKYCGELLSPATKPLVLNLFQDFFCLSLIFSQSSPLFLSLCPFPLSNYYYGVQGLYQSITLNLFQGNSLTCVTPTKILYNSLLKHFTDMLVCNAS